MRKALRSIVGIAAAAALASTIAATPVSAASAEPPTDATSSAQIKTNNDGTSEVTYKLPSGESEVKVTYPKGVKAQLDGGGKGATWWITLSPNDIKAAKAATGGAIGWIAKKLPNHIGGPVAAAALILAPYFVDLPCKSNQSLTISWKVVNAPEPYNYKVTGTKCG